ncbi:MAG: non-heme iron oxygenase ferredoxin subunit [Nocardioidaceae bacterium]|jgi:3-phenylpropionate/trans-cinnamate dioxygenase ferredoxin subunit|nr:non-heme iron oxygenase ferredoxin subunit [Nocardioidaceae bacterium]
MAAVRACAMAELVEGKPLAFEVGGTQVALVRQGAEVFAIRDECSHAAIALSEGDVESCEIECWLHGSTFSLRTGEALNLPATEPVPVYPVTVEGDDVLVDVAHPS